MKKFRMLRGLPILLLLHTGVSLGDEKEVKDVLEGQDVVLECRFSPSDEDEGSSSATLTWIRSSPGHVADNVAIGDQQFSPGYTVEHEPELGRYDLHIKNATYDRDNGAFACRKVVSGSGIKLHESAIDLVVLLPPSPPTLSPINPTVTEGKTFNLSCASIGGSPPPEILWYRIDGANGVAENGEDDVNEENTSRRQQQQQVREGVTFLPGRNRQEPTVSVLSVVPRKEDDGSEYRCTVWNRAIAESELMEASTTIEVNYFARVQVGPENPIMVERDDTAELKCEVDSKPAVTEVKWMRDGRFINTNFRHLIPRANIKDAGPYICSADNGLGQVGKAELQLDVLFGPEVTVPTMKEFAEGEEVVVECQVSSNPRPHAVLWTKEDDPEFRQAGSTLRIAASSPAAAVNGRYTCAATNVIQPTGRQRMERHGNASIVIAVRHAPGKAFIMPEQPTALEGKSVTLECGARPPGFPLPTYRWWRGDGSLSAPPANSAVLATGSTYTIDSVRLASGGQYLCQPTNELGSGSVAATVLQVWQEPRLTSQLAATMVKRSGDTGFSVICSALGKPKPRVTWLKDGVAIDEATSNLYQISVTEQEVRSNEAAFNVLTTLKFVGPDRISKDHLMATDRGQYSCVFENEVGRTDSALLLRIEHSPVVRHLHNKVAADVGETARIACRMQAYPGLRFEWSRGNSLLAPRPPYSMNTTELGDDIFESILEIDHVDESNYDEYACKASNQLGAQKTLITLQPKGRPERPKEVRAVDKGAEFVLLEWEAGFDGGYNTTTYNVEYKELGEGGSTKYADCRWRNPCNLTGLSQYTRYQFKVKAVNIRGDSDWSRDISVTTPVDVARIPTPVQIFYETTSKTVAFNVVNSAGALVGLVARIELENPDGTWRPHAQLGMDDLTYGEMPISDPDVIGLRIRLCVNAVEGSSTGAEQQQQQQPLCGDYGTAEIVEVRAASGFYGGASGGSGLPLGGVIAIAVFASLLALATLALAVKCCCCNNNNNSTGGGRGKKAKKISKEDITAPKGGLHHNSGSNGGYSGSVGLNTIGGYGVGGMDNKGVSAKDLVADSPDIIKSQMYGYNYGAAMPAAQVAAPATAYDQSSSNSNNGGSVNSQDSLWNVKHPNGDPMLVSQQAYTAYYGSDQLQQQQQQQQYAMQQQQQYNYEEYAHYPHPEEYMNERNRAYFHHNGEQYAMPTKQQQQRHRLDSDYSPYGDVSGLPDPYTGHDISDELRAQNLGADGLSFHSHETDLGGSSGGGGVSGPEGYSTPSRRVIREIIV